MTHTDAVAYGTCPTVNTSRCRASTKPTQTVFAQPMADWAWNRLHPHHETTDAMRFGTAFHAYLLGTGTVVALPEGRRSAARKPASGRTSSSNRATSSYPPAEWP